MYSWGIKNTPCHYSNPLAAENRERSGTFLSVVVTAVPLAQGTRRKAADLLYRFRPELRLNIPLVFSA
jgi:hypothetical protein